MYEINRLKIRIKNLSKNAVEYRMTIEEAKNLIAEIERLEKELQEKSQSHTMTTKAAIITRTIDGGSL